MKIKIKNLLKLAFIFVISLVTIGYTLHIIDYYLYSWKYFFCLGSCKIVDVLEENKNLQEKYDLLQIRSQLKENPNYQIEGPFIGATEENRLKVSRTFGESIYTLDFHKEIRLNHYYLIATNSNYSNSTLSRGEPPTKPNYEIKKNLEQMIDEMPLNTAQKNELKSKISIVCGCGRMNFV